MWISVRIACSDVAVYKFSPAGKLMFATLPGGESK